MERSLGGVPRFVPAVSLGSMLEQVDATATS